VKLRVEIIWMGGLLDEGEVDDGRDPAYYIVDADTGQSVDEIFFDTYEEVEAFIARNYPSASRWIASPSKDAVRKLEMVLERIESGALIDSSALRRFFIKYLYQVGYPEHLGPRIHAALQKRSRKG